MDLLGTPIVAWIGFAVLGTAFGLALQVVAKPQGSALPAWLARGRSEELTHAVYGLAVGVLGATFVSLFGNVLGILYAYLGEVAAALLVAIWFAIVTMIGVAGSRSVEQRRRILVAHAKTLGVLALLVLAAVSLGRMIVFRDYAQG